jgi:hypothetical protein
MQWWVHKHATVSAVDEKRVARGAWTGQAAAARTRLGQVLQAASSTRRRRRWWRRRARRPADWIRAHSGMLQARAALGTAVGRHTCERKQLTHMLAGLASMHVPHRQHSTVARVCSTANISAPSSNGRRTPV